MVTSQFLFSNTKCNFCLVTNTTLLSKLYSLAGLVTSQFSNTKCNFCLVSSTTLLSKLNRWAFLSAYSLFKSHLLLGCSCAHTLWILRRVMYTLPRRSVSYWGSARWRRGSACWGRGSYAWEMRANARGWGPKSRGRWPGTWMVGRRNAVSWWWRKWWRRVAICCKEGKKRKHFFRRGEFSHKIMNIECRTQVQW